MRRWAGRLLHDLIIAAVVALIFYFLEQPDARPSIDTVLQAVLAIIIFLIMYNVAVHVKKWLRNLLRRRKETRIFDRGGRFHLNIEDYVFEELKNSGFPIRGLTVNGKTTSFDLVKFFQISSHNQNNLEIFKERLSEIRSRAFELKYSSPSESDEKILGYREVGDWTIPFLDFCSQAGVKNLNNFSVLEVGFGNGDAYSLSNIIQEIENFAAVDISPRSLEIAKKAYPNICTHFAEAESLPFAGSSFDLYLALRTYQSTLFNRRAAIHEAARVLRSGGIFIASIPILYIDDKSGQKIVGLSPKHGVEPSIKYAQFILNEIKLFLEMLGFNNIKTDDKVSEYEIFVSAKAP